MEKITQFISWLTISRTCIVCNEDISDLPKNYKRCNNCRVNKSCNICGKRIRETNRSGKCKDCHLSDKIANDKHCISCNKLLSIKNKSGYCRKCCFGKGRKEQVEIPINNNITRTCTKCNKPFDSIATDFHRTICNNCFTHKDTKKKEKQLAKQGYSKKAIAWLNSIASKEGIKIKHALNGGEYSVTIGNYTFSFDGYCEETNTVYEFYGDKFHGNLQVYDPDTILVNGKTARELYNKTLWREGQILKAGYNLVVIWESQYDKK